MRNPGSTAMVLRNGFTLIELLIVVAIIGVLAAIAVPNFLNAQTRAKIAKIDADMRALATALESYNLDSNAYPPYPLWGGHTTPAYLNSLSTPIAYMNNPEGVDDPFGLIVDHDGQRGQRYGFLNIGPKMGYKAGPIERPPSGFEPIWKGVRLPGSYIWWLTSRGPNKQLNLAGDDPSANPRGVFLLYDASNGLHSSGDIFRFGP